MSTERFKNATSFVINLLNNKTIILLNLAEYRLILADSAYGLVGPVLDDIPRDFNLVPRSLVDEAEGEICPICITRGKCACPT